jgi:ribosomal protein S27AE
MNDTFIEDYIKTALAALKKQQALELRNLIESANSCPKCGKLFVPNMRKNPRFKCEHCGFASLLCRVAKLDFIKNCKILHSDTLDGVEFQRYDYSRVNYLNKKTKVEIVCKRCSGVFLNTPYEHLNGFGCVKCYGSRGVSLIGIWLNYIGLKYTRNKTFKDTNNPPQPDLQFDYFIPSLNLLIEFDGKDHYYPETAERTKDYHVLNAPEMASLVRVTYDQITQVNEADGIEELEDVIYEAVKLIKNGKRIIYTSIDVCFNSDILKKYNLTEYIHCPTRKYGIQYIYTC